jgi:hypothetical protein
MYSSFRNRITDWYGRIKIKGSLAVRQDVGNNPITTPLVDLSFTGVSGTGTNETVLSCSYNGTELFAVKNNNVRTMWGITVEKAPNGIVWSKRGSLDTQGIKLGSTSVLSWTQLVGYGTAGAQDLSFYRDDSGVLAQRVGTNPQESRLYGSYTSDTNYHRLSQKSVRQAITAAAGATLVSTISIPKYSHLIGVTTRVTTALGTSNGTTGYTVGDGTDADLWGVAATATEGTTTGADDFTAADALGPDSVARTITLTATGGNFDGTGVIEVCAFYLRTEVD